MHLRHDDDIRDLEARVALERTLLADHVEDMGRAARSAVASPRGLLVALGTGFLLGELTRSRSSAHGHPSTAASATLSRRAGRSGLVGATALALVRAQFGSPFGLARAIVEHLAARRARRTATTPGLPRTWPDDDPAQSGPARWP